MKLFLAVLLVLLALALVAWIVVKRRASAGASDEPWPFYARRPLSPPEQVLFHRLVEAVPGKIVLAQVQASRVLGVRKGHKFHEWNNRINRLSYDFVVCAKDATVLAAIELDDKSHETAARMDTDRKKEKATAAAGLRLIRWHVRSLPDTAAIRHAFAAATAGGVEPFHGGPQASSPDQTGGPT